MEISFTNLTYSRRASATVGERSFFMIKRFRGGEGHCKERRSLSCDPVNLHVNICIKVQERVWELTMISRNDLIRQTCDI